MLRWLLSPMLRHRLREAASPEPRKPLVRGPPYFFHGLLRADSRIPGSRTEAHSSGMLAHVATGTVLGVEPVPLRVEVNLASGLPAFTVVGLAQHAVREGRERVAAALRNSGFEVPNRRITVNLAPASCAASRRAGRARSG